MLHLKIESAEPGGIFSPDDSIVIVSNIAILHSLFNIQTLGADLLAGWGGGASLRNGWRRELGDGWRRELV